MTRSMSPAEADLFTRAMCCVIASDGRVSKVELDDLAACLTRLGFKPNKDHLQTQVVKACQDIHKRGVTEYSRAMLPRLQVHRGTPFADLLLTAQQRIATSDHVISDEEKAVLQVFADALKASKGEAVASLSRARTPADSDDSDDYEDEEDGDDDAEEPMPLLLRILESADRVLSFAHHHALKWLLIGLVVFSGIYIGGAKSRDVARREKEITDARSEMSVAETSADVARMRQNAFPNSENDNAAQLAFRKQMEAVSNLSRVANGDANRETTKALNNVTTVVTVATVLIVVCGVIRLVARAAGVGADDDSDDEEDDEDDEDEDDE
jgi:uncharacterized tellurite resistance protein B-like protein